MLANVQSLNDKYSGRDARYVALLREQADELYTDAKALREDADHLERVADMLREQAEVI